MLAAYRHIDTAQKIIRIEQSKGRKDRYVKLPDDKDYRLDGSARYKTMTLAVGEFIRRFLVHVLPKRFHRIRHDGLFANGARADNIARARELLKMAAADSEPASSNSDDLLHSHRCPCCGGRMIIIETFERGSTPRYRPATPVLAIGLDTS